MQNTPSIVRPFLFVSILTLGFLTASCSQDVGPNGPRFGNASPLSVNLPSAATMGDYFYSHNAGTRIVYTNTLKVFTHGENSTPDITTGAPDTVRTLGMIGTAPNGDTLFGATIRYRVLQSYAGRPLCTIRYTTGSLSAMVRPQDTVAGASTGPSLAASFGDSLTSPAAGFLRSFTGTYDSTATNWQTDTIKFSAHSDTVIIWQGSGTLTIARTIFPGQNTSGSSWHPCAWDNAATWTLQNADTSITVTGISKHSIAIGNASTNYNGLLTESKIFSKGIGLAQQSDAWYATTNGTARTKHETQVIVTDILEKD